MVLVFVLVKSETLLIIRIRLLPRYYFIGIHLPEPWHLEAMGASTYGGVSGGLFILF
jgi:hypothetical protein